MLFNRMYKEISHLLPRMYQHPFNEALLKGTLPKNVFRFFLEQDYLYLSDFSRALMLVSHKLTSQAHADTFKKFSQEATATQHNLHLQYLGKESHPFGLLSSRYSSTKKIPVIDAYTTHLIQTVQTESAEIAIASLIPCFWLYSTLGKKMITTKDYNLKNPYHLWILSYADEQFALSAKTIVQIAEELNRAKACTTLTDKMVSAFVKSTEHEISLLDAIYQKEELAYTVIQSTECRMGI